MNEFQLIFLGGEAGIYRSLPGHLIISITSKSGVSTLVIGVTTWLPSVVVSLRCRCSFQVFVWS